MGPNMGTTQGYVHISITQVDTLGLEAYPKDDQALTYGIENDQWVDARTGKPTTDYTYEYLSSHNWRYDKPRTYDAEQNAIYNKDSDVGSESRRFQKLSQAISSFKAQRHVWTRAE